VGFLKWVRVQARAFSDANLVAIACYSSRIALSFVTFSALFSISELSRVTTWVLNKLCAFHSIACPELPSIYSTLITWAVSAPHSRFFYLVLIPQIELPLSPSLLTCCVVFVHSALLPCFSSFFLHVSTFHWLWRPQVFWESSLWPSTKKILGLVGLKNAFQPLMACLYHRSRQLAK